MGDKTPRGITILLVEDNALLREMLGSMLAGAGYTVLAAGTEDEAMHHLVGATPIHLLLTDILLLGGLSGPDLVRVARQVRPGLPVLYVSGDPTGERVPTGDMALAAPVLPKPVRRQVLLDTVQALVEAA